MYLEPPKVLAVQEIHRRFSGQVSILEVGFGTGEVLRTLQELGYTNLRGQETSDLLEREVLGNLNIPSSTEGEVVLCFEVLEHQEEPVFFLQSLPGDFLFLSVPNIDRWWVKLTGLYEPWDFPPSHLHRFTEDKLKGFLELSGYVVEEYIRPRVSYKEILQPILLTLMYKLGIKKNVTNYDEVRASNVSFISRLKPLSYIITIPIAAILNLLGYEGKSVYVRATRNNT